MPEGESGRVVISREALVPLGSAAAVVVSLVTSLFWLNGKFTELNDRIVALSYRIDRSDERMADRWTATHQRFWAALMQRNNPTINVPNVDDIIVK